MDELFKPGKARNSLLFPFLIATVLVFSVLYALDRSWTNVGSSSSKDVNSKDAAQHTPHLAPSNVDGHDEYSSGSAEGKPDYPNHERLSVRRDGSNKPYKCIAADGSISYSDSQKKEFCSDGQLVRIDVSTFNVIASQSNTVYKIHEAPQRKSRQVLQEQQPRENYSTRVSYSATCDKYKADLEYVRRRMRAGYKAYEYNRLREKERIAKEGIAKYCK
jgi:hypothetical protein